MAGVMWDSNGLVRCIRAVLPENAVAAITLAIILASNEHCARGPRVMMMHGMHSIVIQLYIWNTSTITS